MKTYLFPGQGSQYKGMGAALFDEFPEITQAADSILGLSIKELCLHDPQQLLHQTQYTQPALYVVNALSYRQKLKETGESPDFTAGHSLGEYNALESSGAISFEDGIKLVKKRGELMSKAPKGAMAAILGSTEKEIREILEKHALTAIDIANFNAPSQTILSGLEQDINKAQYCFENGRFENGPFKFIPLNTSGAFHSRYMAPAQLEFEQYLKEFTFSDLNIPVISNVHAQPYRRGDILLNLAKQITHAVRWSESMQYLLNQGDMAFEELGPGNVLTKLIGVIKEQAVPLNTTKPAVTLEERPVQNSATTVANNREHEIAALNKRINDWNQIYPIGTKVTVKGYDGVMTSQSKAVILFGHRAAIYLEGYNGYFALDEVTPA